MTTHGQMQKQKMTVPSPQLKVSGHTRARRRGSIVKTNLESGANNVDGDGQHIAKASTLSREYTVGPSKWSLAWERFQKEVPSHEKKLRRRCSTGGME